MFIESHTLFDIAAEEEGLLAKLVCFATGSETIPVLGFIPQPTIGFRHVEELADPNDVTKEFPKANTCGNVLMLPILANYNLFKERMNAVLEITIFTDE